MKMPRVVDLDEIGRRKKIVVQASPDNLKTIKEVIPALDLDDRIEELAQGIYEFSIDPISVNVPKLLIQPTMAELEHGSSTRLSDFSNSSDFYRLSYRENTFKIIADEFSDARNLTLYTGFNLVEQKWRLIITTGTDCEILKQTKKPPRSSKSDHDVSLYTTSEFIENFFLKPASENYVRKKWQAGDKSEDTAISLVKPTLIDELGFPLTVPELKYLQSIRNQCMHFRVTTPDDYLNTCLLINKYLKSAHLDELSRIFAGTIKPLLDCDKMFSEMIAAVLDNRKLNYSLFKETICEKGFLQKQFANAIRRI
jgi:hypothetical protein